MGLSREFQSLMGLSHELRAETSPKRSLHPVNGQAITPPAGVSLVFLRIMSFTTRRLLHLQAGFSTTERPKLTARAIDNPQTSLHPNQDQTHLDELWHRAPSVRRQKF